MTRTGTYLRFGDPSWDAPETVAQTLAEPSRPLQMRPLLAAPASRLPTIDLDGVQIHAVTEKQAISHILDELDRGRGGVVITPNLDHLRRCRTDVHFEALVAEADLVVADGMPLVWASRLQGTRLPERVAGSNMISSLSDAAAKRGRSVFMLGGDPGTAEGAAKILQARYPGLKVAGTYCPAPGFERNKKVMGELRELLTASGADIVYVALGSPKQERLISSIRAELPQAWWLGVGVSFSFLTGQVRRAPMWMQRYGVEWIHRLCQEPRRLFKRYLMVGVPFGLQLLGRSVMRGICGGLWRKGAAPAAVDGESAAIAELAARNVIPPPPVADDAAGLAAATNPTTAADVRPTDFVVPTGHAPAERLSKLRALILLGGSVRPGPLALATGRSVLDLPLDETGSLLNFWLSQAVEVSRTAGLERLPVRVLVNQASLEPFSADEKYFGTFRVERDQSEYRGTGGVLRDVAADYADDDLILVANAAQVLLDPLAAIATALERKGGDVCLVSHDDGTPGGVMLLSCKALRLIPATGYVDMKEQMLPHIAARFDVKVVRRRRPTGVPVRTLEDYVQALRFHHRRRAGKPISIDPLAEEFSAAFSLIEPGATVGQGARVHDSVVLAGAVVEPGAALVRSVVCPGAEVRKDRTEVDKLVMAGARRKRGASLATAASVATTAIASGAIATGAVAAAAATTTP